MEPTENLHADYEIARALRKSNMEVIFISVSKFQFNRYECWVPGTKKN